MSDEDIDTGPSEELIQEARNMGWRPKEQYKGDPEKWVDADEYVEKGRHVMPILLENNKRLQKDLLTRDQKIGTLESALNEAKAAIERLDAHFNESNKRDVAAARATLKDRLKEARKEDDVDAEFEIQEALAALNKTPETKPVAAPAKKETASNNLSPEFQAWNDDNPWFGGESPEDRKKTKVFLRIGEDLREDGNRLEGRAFMDKCVEVYDAQQSGSDGKGPGKYESGSNRQGGKQSGSKSFSSLPAEAKQACREDAEMLVGPGKRYKTMGDWEKAYAEKFWEQA